MAWYDEYGTQIIKEARPVDRSRLVTSFLEDPGAGSRIFASHIRHTTAGEAGYVNTRLFYRKFDNNTWIFAHNGKIDVNQLNLPTSEFIPIGNSDSEFIFCGLLSWIERYELRLADKNDFILLHNKLGGIKRFSELNLVFSDGTHLFAYHDRAGHVGLHFLLRHTPYKVVKLRGQHVTIDLAEIIDPNERGYIVASEPLSDES